MDLPGYIFRKSLLPPKRYTGMVGTALSLETIVIPRFAVAKGRRSVVKGHTRFLLLNLFLLLNVLPKKLETKTSENAKGNPTARIHPSGDGIGVCFFNSVV